MFFQTGSSGSQRTEGLRRPGRPRDENLEMPWRPENHDPARSVRPLHGQPGSFPAPGDRCSHSLSRLPCQGGRPAAHWCGTTIGTSLRFCLQSNPAIKRGTKSPLITPCHKVICPEGNPSEENARSWGEEWQKREGERSRLPSRANGWNTPPTLQAREREDSSPSAGEGV